jgi:hypothetical protein
MGNSVQVYLMSDHSGQQIVILTTTWWWQKLKWRGSVSKKLNEVEGKEQYGVEISNRFTALENLRHSGGY